MNEGYFEHVRRQSGREHLLFRKVEKVYLEAQYIEPSGETMPDHHKTEATEIHYDREFERTKTVYCACGEAFRKDENALEHVKEHGVEDEHRYNPDMWEDE